MERDVIVGRVIRVGQSWLDVWVDAEAPGNRYLYRDVERLHAPSLRPLDIRYQRYIGRTVEVHVCGRRHDERLLISRAARM